MAKCLFRCFYFNCLSKQAPSQHPNATISFLSIKFMISLYTSWLLQKHTLRILHYSWLIRERAFLLFPHPWRWNCACLSPPLPSLSFMKCFPVAFPLDPPHSLIPALHLSREFVMQENVVRGDIQPLVLESKVTLNPKLSGQGAIKSCSFASTILLPEGFKLEVAAEGRKMPTTSGRGGAGAEW